ncbi:hypothetical protein [Chrysiogenes arsenatis]|uniref:hypothetical protein n=1 Tax=Chrysiogenes arsenatis TaxID=309797 RepID=UPI0004282034|nr:hypothetical protein [Chrysiogenes arsenatis]
MYNAKVPTKAELPSTGKLLTSTAVAALIAGIILITAVLPAEYGIDPTGIGHTLGLVQMGEIKTSLAEEAAQELIVAPVAISNEQPIQVQVQLGEAEPPTPAEHVSVAVETTPVQQEHVKTITLKPGQGAEIKLTIRKDVKVAYEWFTDGNPVNYDAHGEPFGAAKDFYHGYGKGRNEVRQSGELHAAFDGTHGWFWRNRSQGVVTITLKTRGEYETIKRVI